MKKKAGYMSVKKAAEVAAHAAAAARAAGRAYLVADALAIAHTTDAVDAVADHVRDAVLDAIRSSYAATARAADLTASYARTLVEPGDTASVYMTDEGPITLAEFFIVNPDMDAEARDAILALHPGQTYRGGGGASAEWWIRRERVQRGSDVAGEAPGDLRIVDHAVAEEAPPLSKTLPWVKVTRNPERYQSFLAKAAQFGAMKTPLDVYNTLGPVLAKEDQEVMLAVLLDVGLKLRGVVEVARGGRSQVGVAITDALRAAILAGATSFIICHNHPSGDASPSDADRGLTEAIKKATSLFNEIAFLDHIIIGTGQYYSFEDGAVEHATDWTAKTTVSVKETEDDQR